MAKSRYENITILKSSETRKQNFSTMIYPVVEQLLNDIYIITDQSDRLDLLANKYYNDSTLYWIISLANNILDGNLFIQPGTQLCIPNRNRISDIFTELKKINE